MFSQRQETYNMDKSVLERQQARFKWLQQQQQEQNYYNPNNQENGHYQFQGFYEELQRYDDHHAHVHMEFEQASNNVGGDHGRSRSSSCHFDGVEMVVDEEEAAAGVGAEVALMDQRTLSKCHYDSSPKGKVNAVQECKGKRAKGEAEVESMVKEKTSAENSADSSRSDQKTQRTDYIHVRARRGQATDSHSLAERARREKISKKMKYLQDLVPGCNKITGRAGMLDEIINYVQSLQRQVEFLSMKLAALSPRSADGNLQDCYDKELPAYVSSFPAATASSQIQLNLTQQNATGSKELESAITANPQIIVPERITGPTGFIPEICFNSSNLPQMQPLWSARNPGFHQE